MKPVAGAVFAIVFLVLFNVWREAGWYGVKSWLGKIFFNRPLPRPGQPMTQREQRRRGLTFEQGVEKRVELGLGGWR